MATLNLKNYVPASGKSSVLSYSTTVAGKQDGGYTLASDVVKGGVRVADVTNDPKGSTVNIKLYNNADFAKTGVTALTGDNSQAWSIVGGAENETVLNINTGSKDDHVEMAKMGSGAQVNTGAGNDVISIAAGAGSLKVNAGDGDNTVKIGEVEGALTVTVGKGNNTVSIANAKSSLDVTGDSGDDKIDIDTVSGAATLKLGDGKNTVSITSAEGNVNITAGAGDDSVSIAAVGGNAEINVGNGANYVSVKTVEGTLNVTGGSGADSVSVGVAKGAAVINVGDGNDSVSISSAEDNVTVNTGAGNDTVGVGTVGKDLSVTLGEGKNKFEASGDVAGSATVAGGSSTDDVTLANVAGNATVTLGEGKDSLKVRDVEGVLTVAASGTDANYVELNGSKYEGGVAITLGNGNDSLNLSSSATIGGTISLGDGKDSVIAGTLNAATITSGAGNKEVSIASATDATITFGAGKDSLGIGNVSGSTISMGDGNDILSLGGSMDESTINMGDGNDMVSITVAQKSGTINLGAGNDTISIGAVDMGETTIVGGAGKDSINLANLGGGTVTLSDFEVGTDTLYGNFGTFNKGNFNPDGTITVGTGKVAVTGNGNYAVTTEIGNIAWGGENGTLMNASSFTSKAIFIGDNNEDAADTIIGGTKDDSIYAGNNDVVYGGAGNDSIVISSSATDAAYVGLAANGGKDSVSGFGSKGVVYLFENEITDITKLDVTAAGDTVLKVGTASLTLEKVNGGDVVIRDKNNVDHKVNVVTAAGKTIESDLDKMADIYYSTSKTASLDFSNVDDSLVVDLGNTGKVTNTHKATYTGKFATVTGGKEDTVLFGAGANSETLVAGSGNATLWGGGSASDKLTHSSGTNTVTFFYGSGDGKDTIVSSNWGGSDENDVLWFGSSNLTAIKNDGTNTTVTFGSTGDKLTLDGVADPNTVIKFTTDGKNISKFKVGQSGTSNTFDYAGDVSFYLGGTKNTLRVTSEADSADIWLDGSKGKTYENISTVDASSSTADVVIAGLGNSNETIVASQGNSLIWGGEGSSNDTLVGTSGGTATYFWGNGNGSDVITDSHSDDVVNLYNVALSDIAALDVTSTSMKWTLNDGSSLTIKNLNSSSVKTFQLTDSSWEYDSSSKEWTRLS